MFNARSTHLFNTRERIIKHKPKNAQHATQHRVKHSAAPNRFCLDFYCILKTLVGTGGPPTPPPHSVCVPHIICPWLLVVVPPASSRLGHTARARGSKPQEFSTVRPVDVLASVHAGSIANFFRFCGRKAVAVRLLAHIPRPYQRQGRAIWKLLSLCAVMLAR